jgi:hypothetical protein
VAKLTDRGTGGARHPRQHGRARADRHADH